MSDLTELLGLVMIVCGLLLLALNSYHEDRIRKLREELEDLIEKEKNRG